MFDGQVRYAFWIFPILLFIALQKHKISQIYDLNVPDFSTQTKIRSMTRESFVPNLVNYSFPWHRKIIEALMPSANKSFAKFVLGEKPKI